MLAVFGAESFSSSLLSKHLNNKIYKNIILPVVMYGVKLCRLH